MASSGATTMSARALAEMLLVSSASVGARADRLPWLLARAAQVALR
jgi:hypothetical protein